MTLNGVFVNGQVQFDDPPNVPDGTRVRVKVLREPLFRMETPEEELAGMMEAFEDIKAGRVRPWEEVRKELDERIHRRLSEG